jgi:hypothetical protein
VVALAEAVIILDLSTNHSVDTLMRLLQREQASINAKIGDELLLYFCNWLETWSATDIKYKFYFKTPQTLKSGAKTLSRPAQDTDSD